MPLYGAFGRRETAVGATPVTLAWPYVNNRKPTACAIEIDPSSGPIRFTTDGTTPVAGSVGMVLAPGDPEYAITDYGSIKRFLAVAEAGAAIMNERYGEAYT